MQSLLQIFLKYSVLACVVPEQGLLVLPGEGALCVGAAVGATVREDLVYSLLEMLHHQVVLFLSVLVLGFWFEAAQLACVSCSEAICIFGQSLYVQHVGCFAYTPCTCNQS